MISTHRILNPQSYLHENKHYPYIHLIINDREWLLIWYSYSDYTAVNEESAKAKLNNLDVTQVVELKFCMFLLHSVNNNLGNKCMW